MSSSKEFWNDKWIFFKDIIPHQQYPYSKKNWGHNNHSLCSYQGKLKPAIAHHLVETFVPIGGSVLDTFSGVGTIPFEAALNGRKAYGFDISLPAYYISLAKVSKTIIAESQRYLDSLAGYIDTNQIAPESLENARSFGFNKKIVEYYHEQTLNEVLLARDFVKKFPPNTPSEMLVVACLMHILHGNRPYALSRRSHSIVPYAPTGDFIYRNLIGNLSDKVNRSFSTSLGENFVEGDIFYQDATNPWPYAVNDLDAIITSPPFFDSTRFYLANWLRIWFSGWSEVDFKEKPKNFIEEQQKMGFKVYESIFQQAKERLKTNGILVLHLGKSKKCDMAYELSRASKKWFKTIDLFDESVVHCESHGIKDKGTVTSHQYLILGQT